MAAAGDLPSLDMHQETTFMVVHPMSPMYNTLIQFDPHNDPTFQPREPQASVGCKRE